MIASNRIAAEGVDPQIAAFYGRTLDLLVAHQVPFLLGGAYALSFYSGITRHTKDLDVFLRPRDVPRAMKAFEAAGHRTEATHPHWVCKAIDAASPEEPFVDLIFRASTGIGEVDDEWFAHSETGQILGRTVPICPVEESIWIKCFVMGRERFDGADVNHLLLARAATLDWSRLIRRFETHRRVLLAHLLLFAYVYPAERSLIPDWVVRQLIDDMRSERPVSEPICRGTMLTWNGYLVDVERWGYRDARLRPYGVLTQEEIDRWTAAPK